MPSTSRPISGAWKAKGGLIRVDASVVDGRLRGVRITGDFFIFPPEALEEVEMALSGVAVDRDAMEGAVSRVLDSEDVEALGFGPTDVVNAVLGPREA